MLLTSSLIKEYIKKGNKILIDSYPEYKNPTISSIRITSAKSYWGQILKTPDNSWSLKISNYISLIEDEKSFQCRLMSCVIHELIHTIDGCFNHGKKFKQIAAAVNLRYPQYNITTETAAEDYNITIPESPNKYKVTCTQCGYSYFYKRKSGVWSYVNKPHSPYCCGRCGNNSFTGEVLR